MDLAVMIRNAAVMTDRARRQWRDTPRWRFQVRADRHENYRGWQRKLDELRVEAEQHRSHVHWVPPNERG